MDRPPSPVEALLLIIRTSFERPNEVPHLIDRCISRNRRLSSKDRREFLNLAHQSMRWRRRLWGEILPTTVDLTKLRTKLEEADAFSKNPPYEKLSKLSVDRLAQEISFPTWLIEQWVGDQGMESTVQLAVALNQPADTCLRVNTLKTDRDSLIEQLKKENVGTQACTLSPLGLKLTQRYNLHETHAFKNGSFEIQDEGSQLAALLSGAQPGQTVIDACARTGGKSLALACLMENRGKILACDVDARVFDELKARAGRAGATIIEPQWVAPDDPNPLPKYEGRADLVLVDAPCSGLGVLRRKSWKKWSMMPSLPPQMGALQLKILRRYARYVKAGGKLMFVTCTIHSEENAKVVRAFLESESGFSAIEDARTFRPDLDGTDGFFVASFGKART